MDTINYELLVDNIKCGGCANSIKTALSSLEGVQAVEVDIERGAVNVSGGETLQREALLEVLRTKGYPEQGSVEGIEALGVKAKSFVSCAVGRMSDSE